MLDESGVLRREGRVPGCACWAAADAPLGMLGSWQEPRGWKQGKCAK